MSAIPCVLYAAKSTEDTRGSIPGQLGDCRDAVARAGERTVAGEYSDEACSAYLGDRGPGLVDALAHAEELAREQGTAELWAQHSDRVARGDGRSARHAVEIALWALKTDVRVRIIQDPDTFRDLLYAVVTGQRNHEDSRRKGLASAAGRRRAVERGEYTGAKADGYMRVVEVDETGAIKRRLDFDPERRPLIEMMFRMALRGKPTGAIARAANKAGWRTKPQTTSSRPQAWNIERVQYILRNPRYAGLSATKGEVLGRGHWPAYISERQHHRLRARLARPRWTKEPRQLEPYLLARLARCGFCGSSMHCHTGREREDGTWARRYVCRSHRQDQYGTPRCPAPRIDADMAEAMFVSAIRTLLVEGEEEVESGGERVSLGGAWSNSPERQRVLDAVLSGDDAQIDAALEALAGRIAPESAMLRRVAASSRHVRRLEVARAFEAWAREDHAGRTEVSRLKTRELQRSLRSWFSTLSLAMDGSSVAIVAHRRSPDRGAAPVRVEARFDRREWVRSSPLARRAHRHCGRSGNSEILGALQAWADANGRSPRATDWFHASIDHPSATTVQRQFKRWNRALKRASLEPRGPEVRPWSDDEVIRALRRWTKRHGRPPKRDEWLRSGPGRPCKTTVCSHFGNWRSALAAAGLTDMNVSQGN